MKSLHALDDSKNKPQKSAPLHTTLGTAWGRYIICSHIYLCHGRLFTVCLLGPFCKGGLEPTTLFRLKMASAIIYGFVVSRQMPICMCEAMPPLFTVRVSGAAES